MPSRSGVWIAALCVCSLYFVSGCSGGSSRGSTPVAPAVATPTVSSVAPSVVLAGSTTTTVTITGAGFTTSTVVQLGGVTEPTTYVSSTQVTAVIPTSQLLAAGTAAVVASNGGTSVSAGTVTLEIDNPLPSVTQISPTTLTAGSASASVAITGTGFVTGTTVQVDGSARQTTFVSGTQVTALLTAADLANPGTHAIAAVNPSPGGHGRFSQ